MSFTDKLVLWLHIAFAIFTIGPVTLAIASTPRYIRKRDVAILRYLSRTTVIFTAAALLVLIFGVVLGQLDHDFGHAWLTVAMTLFIVAIVLLVLVIRDQRRAIKALATGEMPQTAAPDAGASQGDISQGGTGTGQPGDEPADAGSAGAGQLAAGQLAAGQAQAAHIASVERGRIAAMGGVVNLIWLVILVLMVWRP